MIINSATLKVSRDSPDGHSDRSEEGSGDVGLGVEDEEKQSLPHGGPSRSDRCVDVDVRSTRVAAELRREDEAEDRKALVRGGEDPGLEGATRGGLSSRPAPEPLVKASEDDHGEGSLEQVVEVGEVGSKDENLRGAGKVSPCHLQGKREYLRLRTRT